MSDEVPEPCALDGAFSAERLALALATTANRVRTAPAVAFENGAVRAAAHVLHDLLEIGLAAPPGGHDVRVGGIGLDIGHRRKN